MTQIKQQPALAFHDNLHALLGPHHTEEKVSGDMIPGTSASKLRKAEVSMAIKMQSALGCVWAGETQTRVWTDMHAYVHGHVYAHALTHVPLCAYMCAETDTHAPTHVCRNTDTHANLRAAQQGHG